MTRENYLRLEEALAEAVAQNIRRLLTALQEMDGSVEHFCITVRARVDGRELEFNRRISPHELRRLLIREKC